jgi:hypothetical protein
MNRHRPDRKTFVAIHGFRERQAQQRSSNAPENSGMSLQEIEAAILKIGKSAHKIPKKLLPKSPF